MIITQVNLLNKSNGCCSVSSFLTAAQVPVSQLCTRCLLLYLTVKNNSEHDFGQGRKFLQYIKQCKMIQILILDTAYVISNKAPNNCDDICGTWVMSNADIYSLLRTLLISPRETVVLIYLKHCSPQCQKINKVKLNFLQCFFSLSWV